MGCSLLLHCQRWCQRYIPGIRWLDLSHWVSPWDKVAGLSNLQSIIVTCLSPNSENLYIGWVCIQCDGGIGKCMPKLLSFAGREQGGGLWSLLSYYTRQICLG